MNLTVSVKERLVKTYEVVDNKGVVWGIYHNKQAAEEFKAHLEAALK